MEKFDEEEDIDSVIVPIEPIKGLDDDEDAITADEDDVEVDLLKDGGGSDDENIDDEDDEDIENNDNNLEDEDGEA